MTEETSGPARYILAKMNETIGSRAGTRERIQWLEENAREYWQGDKDLPLFTVADNLVIEAQIVVPGSETLEKYPDTGKYGVHFVKNLIAPGFHGDVPYEIIQEVEGDRGIIHSPEYEYKTGNLIKERMGEELSHLEYLGYSNDSIRSRVIPGQSLNTLIPMTLRSRISGHNTRVLTADVVEGLELWNTIKHAFGCLKELNEKGVAHRDGALRNFMLLEGKVVPIDFGGATISEFQELTTDQTMDLLEKEVGQMATVAADLQYHITGRIDDPLAEAMVEWAIEHNKINNPGRAKQYEHIPEMTANLSVDIPEEYEWGPDEGPTSEDLEEIELLGLEEVSLSM